MIHSLEATRIFMAMNNNNVAISYPPHFKLCVHTSGGSREYSLYLQGCWKLFLTEGALASLYGAHFMIIQIIMYKQRIIDHAFSSIIYFYEFISYGIKMFHARALYCLCH